MTTKTAWHSPNHSIPEQGSDVEVIIHSGKHQFGKFVADDNWEIKGHTHDLYNDDIIAWRLTEQRPK